MTVLQRTFLSSPNATLLAQTWPQIAPTCYLNIFILQEIARAAELNPASFGLHLRTSRTFLAEASETPVL